MQPPFKYNNFIIPKLTRNCKNFYINVQENPIL